MADPVESPDDQAKKQAETAKIRSDIEIARQAGEQAATKAALDNETARLANEKARQDARDAADDRLAARAKNLVTDISNVPQNSLTLPDGYVFHGAEITDKLLDAILAVVAAALHDRPGGDSEPVFITDGANLAEVGAQYQDALTQVTSLLAASQSAQQSAGIVSGGGGTAGFASLSDIATAALTVVPAVANAVMSVLQIDTSLGGSSRPADTTQIHARLAMRLLAEGIPAAIVQDYALPRESSELLAAVSRLRDSLAALQSAQNALAARLATTPDNDPERPKLEAQKRQIDAVLERGSTFLLRLTTIAAGQTHSPLGQLLILEPALDRSDTAPTVIILPPPVVSIDQVVIRRRILRSRIVVAGYARSDWLLSKKGVLVAGGSTSATAGFSVKFRGRGPAISAYTGLGEITATSATQFPMPADESSPAPTMITTSGMSAASISD